ncbi:hypothetical protein ACIRQY_34035 [Streptomyces sp. NPDC101490]|uniref:hypothetical protein n=1 Tax=Streptomyces sp. NPDC101490 TaxID=3366143 RepID=UPI00380F66A3
MTVVTRLVTYVDLDGSAADTLSVSARLEAVLTDGRSLVLLDDRGWTQHAMGSAGIAPRMPAEDFEETARMVVGPDETDEDETHGQAAAGHWGWLADRLGQQGVRVEARDMERLPHDVVLSERLRRGFSLTEPLQGYRSRVRTAALNVRERDPEPRVRGSGP